MESHPSIGGSLTVLAEVASVPLRGFDDDQLDIVVLRLVAEPDDEPVLTRIGHIIDQVRHAEGVVDERIERERVARQKLIESHDAEETPAGLFLVPRRPELLHPPQAGARTTRGRFA
jgi:hypothetical protein